MLKILAVKKEEKTGPELLHCGRWFLRHVITYSLGGSRSFKTSRSVVYHFIFPPLFLFLPQSAHREAVVTSNFFLSHSSARFRKGCVVSWYPLCQRYTSVYLYDWNFCVNKQHSDHAFFPALLWSEDGSVSGVQAKCSAGWVKMRAGASSLKFMTGLCNHPFHFRFQTLIIFYFQCCGGFEEDLQEADSTLRAELLFPWFSLSRTQWPRLWCPPHDPPRRAGIFWWPTSCLSNIYVHLFSNSIPRERPHSFATCWRETLMVIIHFLLFYYASLNHLVR